MTPIVQWGWVLSMLLSVITMCLLAVYARGCWDFKQYGRMLYAIAALVVFGIGLLHFPTDTRGTRLVFFLQLKVTIIFFIWDLLLNRRNHIADYARLAGALKCEQK